MKRALLKIAASYSISTRSLPKNIPNPNYVTSPFYSLSAISSINSRFFATKNHSTEFPDQPLRDSDAGPPQYPDVEDVSKEELKSQIERYLAGDPDAIPKLFEGILKRKLTGKHEESDDEIMEEFRKIPLNDAVDKDVSDEDISDGDTSDDDFGIKHHGDSDSHDF